MYKFILFTFLLVQLLSAQIFKSNFDSALPSEGLNWPNVRGTTWEGWVPRNFDESVYGDGDQLSTAIYHSAPRSLMIQRLAGKNGTVDIWHDLPSSYKELTLEYWIYFGTGFATNPGYNIPYNDPGCDVHFIFINSSVAPTPMPVDFTQYTPRNPWPPTCLDTQNGGVVFSMKSTNIDGNGTFQFYGSDASNCTNVRTLVDGRWHSIKHYWNLTNHTAKMWIDGRQIMDITNFRQTSVEQSGINRFAFSGWCSTASQIGFAAVLYIDDVVVTAGTTTTPPPVEPPPVEPNEPISLKVTWDDPNQIGVVENFIVYGWQGSDTTSSNLTQLLIKPAENKQVGYEVPVTVTGDYFRYAVKPIATNATSNMIPTKFYSYKEFNPEIPVPVPVILLDPVNVKVIK